MLRTASAITVLVSVVALASGCGSSGSSSATTTSPPTVSVPTGKLGEVASPPVKVSTKLVVPYPGDELHLESVDLPAGDEVTESPPVVSKATPATLTWTVHTFRPGQGKQLALRYGVYLRLNGSRDLTRDSTFYWTTALTCRNAPCSTGELNSGGPFQPASRFLRAVPVTGPVGAPIELKLG